MTVSEQLEAYMVQLGCTARELSAAAGISPAAMSRYRTGERLPKQEQLGRLAQGVAALAAQKNCPGLTAEAVLAQLQQAPEAQSGDAEVMREKLNTLISVLGIRINELAQAINFDSSYLYRICSGERKPADLGRFADGVCRYASERCDTQLPAVAALVGCDEATLSDMQARVALLRTWLCGDSAPRGSSMEQFLQKLDAFDLEQHIRAVHFDELKVPTVPFSRTANRCYYGTEQMRRGELDFFRATVLSKSHEPIFMCSDMPMEEMAQDVEFGKKWMYAIAMSLKKGLQLNIIHNVDRPLNELLLGLESWIPLYMTGQISPYQLKGYSARVYHHMLYVSGVAALSGECLHGCHAHGRYELTGKKDALAYYRQRANDLLKMAQPLMEIYPAARASAFRAYLHASRAKTGSRREIHSSLPIYTIEPSLLQAMLTRAGVTGSAAETLLRYAAEERAALLTVLQRDTVLSEIPALSQAEFSREPMTLSLSGAFCETQLAYTWEEYTAHLHQTQAFALSHPGYTLRETHACPFRNLQISILGTDSAVISKNKVPVIHFVIRQPKMLSALRCFSAPIVESY